jgi:Fic family protein
VENNFRILQFACETGERTPISVALIRRMHEMLFDGLDAAHVSAGAFRHVPNFIGHTARIEDARYVPPPPASVPQCMRDLVDYVRRPGDLPTVVRCAMAHYQFEAIHPFIDGNGRVGRALVLLMLNREGVLPVPLLNPSAALERRRRDYYDLLLDVTRRGAWAPWVEFFASCVEREATDACHRLVRLDALRGGYCALVAADRRAGSLNRVIEDLFADPSVTSPGVAARLGIDGATAQRLVARLEAKGILREVTGRRRNRVYLAQQIVDVFSDAPVEAGQPY